METGLAKPLDRGEARPQTGTTTPTARRTTMYSSRYANRPVQASKTAPASDAQLGFIASLASRTMGREGAANYMAIVRNALDQGLFSKAQASDAITALKAQPVYQAPAGEAPAAPQAATSKVTEPGMYRTADGTMYRVQRARTSGGLYAKVLTGNAEEGYHFGYAAGAIRSLTAEDRMTVEEARAFGVETGTCCVCAAVLTNPTSVSLGIGPVCGGRV